MEIEQPGSNIDILPGFFLHESEEKICTIDSLYISRLNYKQVKIILTPQDFR